MGTVALLSAAVAFAPASPSSVTPLSCDCGGFSGESLFCSGVFQFWLTKLFSEPVPSRLRRFVVNQPDEDIVWEPPGQVVSRGAVFLLPLLDGLVFCVCGVGSVFQDGTRGCPIKVAPAVHGLHGFLETHGENGPVGSVILEMWGGGEECWNRHGNVVGTFCSNDSWVYWARAGPITCRKE